MEKTVKHFCTTANRSTFPTLTTKEIVTNREKHLSMIGNVSSMSEVINRDNYQVKVDEEGTIRVYDPKTNTFGSYNPDGSTKTYFKPTGGQNYFDKQPGK